MIYDYKMYSKNLLYILIINGKESRRWASKRGGS